MPAKLREFETSLLDWTDSWLREKLPHTWDIEIQPSTGGRENAFLKLRSPDGSTASIALEIKRPLTPKGAEEASLWATVAATPTMIVAPWLSPRTQELLSEGGVNYIDQTGNARLQVDSPSAYINSRGSSRNPNPEERGKVRLRGDKAGRLIRTLIDVFPPYTVKELSEATGLAPGYVSRALAALDDEALIEREPRGPVQEVEVPALLRRWATTYDVFRSNDVSTFIAPAGLQEILGGLRGRPIGDSPVVITGSVAAARISPVTSPATLTAFCANPKQIADACGLLPADEGANVLLLRPFDPVVWTGTRDADGLTVAAPSQVAVDCLTGNGRMPAEGVAVLEWMTSNEPSWRKDRLRADPTFLT